VSAFFDFTRIWALTYSQFLLTGLQQVELSVGSDSFWADEQKGSRSTLSKPNKIVSSQYFYAPLVGRFIDKTGNEILTQ
jgi:hypothetical protein